MVQVGERDSVVPSASAKRAAARAGRYGEFRAYPVDHFDVYDGPVQQQLLSDQLAFLDRHLAVRQLAGRRVPPYAGPASHRRSASAR